MSAASLDQPSVRGGDPNFQGKRPHRLRGMRNENPPEMPQHPGNDPCARYHCILRLSQYSVSPHATILPTQRADRWEGRPAPVQLRLHSANRAPITPPRTVLSSSLIIGSLWPDRQDGGKYTAKMRVILP